MRFLFLLASIFTVSVSANAGGVYDGQVKAIVCHSEGVSDYCLLDIDDVEIQNESDCSKPNNRWDVAFKATNNHGKNMLSLALAAQMSSSDITVAASGLCDVSGIESVSYLWLDAK